MKKIISIILMAAAVVPATAQNWQDALLFSENNYSGTARTVGMGNAVTAIGGDPGTLVFNPAGSAVAAYSQFSITPGLSFSSASATGTILEGDTQPIGFGDQYRTGFMRAKMPNLSYISSMDTGKRHGLKRYAFGFAFSSTNNYTSRFNAAGVNADNSFAASLASSADGFSKYELGGMDWYESQALWRDMVGYRSGMINGVDGMDGAYIALTETMDQDGNFRLAAPVFQQYGRQTTGYKSDFLINFALNFSDNLYVGANLGFTTLNYNQVEYWKESPANENEFPTIGFADGTTARFSSLLMQYNYRASGAGMYLKAGVLWRPFPALRLAAAVQTPTVMHLTERYGYKGQVSLSGKAYPSSSSPEDQWTYQLREPVRLNAGLAFSLGTFAVLSADYEMTDYGACRFAIDSSEEVDFIEATFAQQNREIKEVLGVTHMLRAGLEVKPLPAVALRAGYNLTTGAEKDYASLLRHAFSLGAGYSSNGPFYLDMAVRLRTVPNEYLIPYEYYYAPDPDNYVNKVVWETLFTPEVEVRSFVVDALLTLGWRF